MMGIVSWVNGGDTRKKVYIDYIGRRGSVQCTNVDGTEDGDGSGRIRVSIRDRISMMLVPTMGASWLQSGVLLFPCQSPHTHRLAAHVSTRRHAAPSPKHTRDLVSCARTTSQRPLEAPRAKCGTGCRTGRVSFQTATEKLLCEQSTCRRRIGSLARMWTQRVVSHLHHPARHILELAGACRTPGNANPIHRIKRSRLHLVLLQPFKKHISKYRDCVRSQY